MILGLFSTPRRAVRSNYGLLVMSNFYNIGFIL